MSDASKFNIGAAVFDTVFAGEDEPRFGDFSVNPGRIRRGDGGRRYPGTQKAALPE